MLNLHVGMLSTLPILSLIHKLADVSAFREADLPSMVCSLACMQCASAGVCDEIHVVQRSP